MRRVTECGPTGCDALTLCGWCYPLWNLLSGTIMGSTCHLSSFKVNRIKAEISLQVWCRSKCLIIMKENMLISSSAGYMHKNPLYFEALFWGQCFRYLRLRTKLSYCSGCYNLICYIIDIFWGRWRLWKGHEDRKRFATHCFGLACLFWETLLYYLYKVLYFYFVIVIIKSTCCTCFI